MDSHQANNAHIEGREWFTVSEWRTLQVAPFWVLDSVAFAGGRPESRKYERQQLALGKELDSVRLRAADVVFHVLLEFQTDPGELGLARSLVNEGCSLFEAVVVTTAANCVRPALFFAELQRLYSEDSRASREGLAQVAEILKAKATPEQARGFKEAMLLIGEKVAMASGSGLLGLGRKVSDAEKAALEAVSRQLSV